MKRRLLALTLALLIAVATIWGTQLTESILDQKLAPLLSEAIGLPVTLGPTSVNLLTLRARSPELTMGVGNNPAIVAQQVQVRLSWKSLLQGEIRLQHVEASDLMVSVSRWPSNNNPWPENYQFLDQWIPDTLQVASANYLAADSSSYPVTSASWSRLPGNGARVAWSEQRLPGEVTVTATLDSLPELLQLSSFALNATLAGPDIAADDHQLQLSIDAQAEGYQLTAKLLADSLQFTISAGNSTTWTFPAESKIELAEFAMKDTPALLKRYTGSSQEPDIEAFLQTSLPQLNLPEHRGQLLLGKFHIGPLYAIDNRIKFQTGSDGIELLELNSLGPSGHLTASGRIQQDSDGWQLTADSAIVARKNSTSIGQHLLESDWRWHSGHINIDGEGSSWGQLLDSSRGKLQLAGTHNATQPTPVTVSAILGREGSAFGLQDIDIDLGDSHITGTLGFPGGKERQLMLDLTAETLDLNFLFEISDTAGNTGIAVPRFLALYPDIELLWNFKLHSVRIPVVDLATANINLRRSAEGGHFSIKAKGIHEGAIAAKLAWTSPANLPDNVTLDIDLQEMDLARLFQQQDGLFHDRTSGKIEFSSQGNGVVDIFEAMRGKAEFTTNLRSDNNWQRAAKPGEQIKLSGNAALVVKDAQILGLEIEQLQIASIQQDVTGQFSMVAGRKPWLRANLQSQQLNITRLQEMIPKSEEQADRADLLNSLRLLGPFRLRYSSDVVQFAGAEFSKVLLDVTSDEDLVKIDHLDFSLENGTARSSAELVWQGDAASLSVKGKVDQLILDHFLQPLELDSAVPLRGSFTLAGHGSSVQEMGTNLSGNVDLQAAAPAATPDQRRQLQLKLEKIPHGVKAIVEAFILGSSELQGTARYTRPPTGRPLLEVALDGGQLSLRRWENTDPATTAKTDKDASLLSRTAAASSSAVHEVLSAPARLLDDEEEDVSSAADEKETHHRIFDEQPLPLDFLKLYDLKLQGKLDALTSRVLHARAIDFDIVNTAGSLKAKVKAGYLNGGTADLDFSYDLGLAQPPASLTLTLTDIHEEPEETTNPRTAFIAVSSLGESEAQLADNLSGEIYVELGRGPLNYGGISFLTANAAKAMFTTLIPGAERKTPELQCAVTMVIFKDGTGVTPYGYAGQTLSANLLGRVETDLKEETIRVAFNSRSREGVGLSLGNMFSNSVRIQGPLDNPRIVPNTTSLLWRGWAAFATAGLSMVGEGVLNRTLAGKDPCGDIRKDIRKETCAGDSAAAASPLVCPSAQQVN